MSFGLEFTNDNGSVLVDSTFVNHQVTQTGTATSTEFDASVPVRFCHVILPTPIPISQMPIVFLLAVSGSDFTLFGAFRNEIEGGYITGIGWECLRGDHGGSNSMSFPTVHWLVATPAKTPTENWGVRVRNTSGVTVFSSEGDYLNVLHDYHIPGSTSFSGGPNVSVALPTLTSGKAAYAQINGVFGYNIDYGGFGAAFVRNTYAGISNTGRLVVQNAGLTRLAAAGGSFSWPAYDMIVAEH